MAESDAQVKLLLDERDIPTHWYNLVPDLPHPPAPVLHPGTGQPIGPADLAPLFPLALIGQEVSQPRTIESPGEGRDIHRRGRPPGPPTAPSIRPRTSTTSTRAPARPPGTNRTRPSRRPTTTKLKAFAA